MESPDIFGSPGCGGRFGIVVFLKWLNGCEDPPALDCPAGQSGVRQIMSGAGSFATLKSGGMCLTHHIRPQILIRPELLDQAESQCDNPEHAVTGVSVMPQAHA